jgi:hypothetical protein
MSQTIAIAYYILTRKMLIVSISRPLVRRESKSPDQAKAPKPMEFFED